ncbi:polysaccharide deacetylase family protein [Taibaiella koreensis]|uniref:polysaccharide deacetylase family protein n=1 Tax=Taibaiella koreensis TaxID=1268548 RepID=UPI000E59C987|nr:polysaccharide deacetylase family protein [Taibaiella koreensis]
MGNNPGKILFSIDLEEFDIPGEYGLDLPLQTKLEVSLRGMQALEALMDRYQVRGTLFTTAFWAQHYPDYVRRLSERHEIASHTFYHNRFEAADLARSREVLTAITGKEVTGLRMPLMQEIDTTAVAAAGYTYDSSLHPTWLPGRYNHLKASRTLYAREDLWILPASVTPLLRLPVFWLMLKNMPISLYKLLCRRILIKDGYIVLYVHPWEFTDLSTYPLPSLIKRKDGGKLLSKLEALFAYFSKVGCTFETHASFIKSRTGVPQAIPSESHY